MPDSSIKLEFAKDDIKGYCFYPETKRAILFLIFDAPKKENAKNNYDKLPDPARRGMQRSFRRWLERQKPLKEKHHGYSPKSAYHGLYTFKNITHKNRLHGFLVELYGLEICVITHYQKKTQDEVDDTLLNKVKSLYQNQTIIDEIKIFIGNYIRGDSL